MNYRVPFLAALAISGGAGVFAVACSSTTTVDPNVTADGSVESGPSSEAGGDGGGGKPDAKTIPVCTMNAIQGPCDLVSQNCPSGKECVQLISADGGAGTLCQDPGTGALAEGELCAPPSNGDNPCVAGLQCQNGRCAHPCCANDSTVCGTTKEGYPGICDLNIVDGKGNPLFMVCEYPKPCEPFGVQSCGQGQTCLVKDGVGTSSCSDIYQPPGVAEGKPCSAANECADGMMCIGSGSNVCTYVCWNKLSKTPLPFDGGALDGGAGFGGCPKAKTCKPVNWGGKLPDWLGTCQ